MSRAEELSTKLRTLSYDHERLMSMHRTANEKAANAEREANLHKSRLACVLHLCSVMAIYITHPEILQNRQPHSNTNHALREAHHL